MKKTFTLVELIIVITILAILSVSAFLVVSQRIWKSRDSRRLSDLSVMQKWLELSLTELTRFPTPDSNVTINANSGIVWYQWQFCASVSSSVGIKTIPKDPLDAECYTYYTNKDRNAYQLLVFLENSLTNSYKKETISADYSQRIIKLAWSQLGIVLDPNNMPVNLIWNSVDITTTTAAIKLLLDQDNIIVWTWLQTRFYAPNSSCKKLNEILRIKKSGQYMINPLWTGEVLSYCDMETDGGWWTISTVLADPTTRNLFDTTSWWALSANIGFVSNISVWVTRWNILDLRNDNKNKDILIKCVVTDPNFRWYTLPLLIKDFPKDSTSNLVKFAKASTTLHSSTELKVTRNNKTYWLLPGWWVSWFGQSHYFTKSWPEQYLFALAWWSVLYVGSWNASTPYYYVPWLVWELQLQLSSNNYCYTALR